MIDKNLIFSPAKFIVPIFYLSNQFDFLTYRLIRWLSVVLQTINRRSCTITKKAPTWAFSMVIVKTDCETDGSSEAIVVCDNKQCGKKETNYELYSEETNPRHLFLLPVAAG